MPIAPSRPPDSWRTARVLVVVAHPDDEVLGCGGLLTTLGDVRVVHVTDGAPRDARDALRHGFRSAGAYAEARRQEAETALAIAGIGPERIVRLGFHDQEAASSLAGIVAALRLWMAAADVVLTHVFEGGHPDHDAVAFAVDACRERMNGPKPAVYAMPFYHGDETGWVRQRFPSSASSTGDHAIELTLDPDQQTLKRQMLAAHRSQAETLKSFATETERFRPARSTDFLQRPHPGPLLYERHGWNLTWARWQASVRDALQALG